VPALTQNVNLRPLVETACLAGRAWGVWCWSPRAIFESGPPSCIQCYPTWNLRCLSGQFTRPDWRMPTHETRRMIEPAGVEQTTYLSNRDLATGNANQVHLEVGPSAIEVHFIPSRPRKLAQTCPKRQTQTGTKPARQLMETRACPTPQANRPTTPNTPLS